MSNTELFLAAASANIIARHEAIKHLAHCPDRESDRAAKAFELASSAKSFTKDSIEIIYIATSVALTDGKCYSNNEAAFIAMIGAVQAIAAMRQAFIKQFVDPAAKLISELHEATRNSAAEAFRLGGEDAVHQLLARVGSLESIKLDSLSGRITLSMKGGK